MEGRDASLQAARAARAKLDAALDAQFASLERRVAAAKEKWREAEEAAAPPKGPLPETLELNVGGDTSLTISRETITRTPSRLAQMFSGRWDHMLPRDSEGRFFLDLDSRQMQAIFTWLTELAGVGPNGPPPPHPRDVLPDEHKWGIDELMHHFRLTEPRLQGPTSGDVAGSVQQHPVPQEHDEHGVSGAVKELSDAVASCARRADESEEEAQAMRAALDEERTFMEAYVAAFRAEGSTIVPLNVSGVPMATARATLLHERGSMLATKFGPAWTLQDEELVDGGVSMKADPAAFALVLRYLRLLHLGVPDVGPLPPQAAEGAVVPALLDYYGISLKRRRLAESAIMSHEQQLQVGAWLPQGARAELLFRASRDGFEAETFHALCDGRRATLVVALSARGRRFGGFADAPWGSPATGAYSECTGSFLFRLGGPEGEPLERCAMKPEMADQGIYCHSGYGPTFGGGHDWWVRSGSGSCQCNFNMGQTYEPSAAGSSTLAEGNHVYLKDYEVFGID